jgi:anti-sigma factor RsiW
VNANVHPTIDRIADHEAGLLSVEQAREVAAHLADCAACRDIVTRLAEVSDLLEETGRVAPAMPADVAASLDAALARATAERRAGVPSLADRRTTGSPARADVRRPGRLLVGAAAAIAVFAVGGALVSNGLPGSSSPEDQTSAGSAADHEASGKAGGGAQQPEGSRSPTVGSLQQSGKPRLNRDNVADYAAALSMGTITEQRVRTACAGDVAMANGSVSGRKGKAVAGITFDGQDALLRVDRHARQLVVLACPGPTRVLYRSTY